MVAAEPTIRIVVDPASHSAFQPRLEAATSGSGIPANFVLEDASQSPVDYMVRLFFDARELPLKDIEQIWGATSLLLLTMYPATCNRYRFSLDARVEDAAGAQIKSYSIEDIDTAWLCCS